MALIVSRIERLILALLAPGGLALAGQAWLADHPQHDPRAPLDLRHPLGWATAGKLAALREDPASCHRVLARSDVSFTPLDGAGEGACRRDDRLILPGAGLAPAGAQMTCALAAALVLWLEADVQPLAHKTLGSEVAQIAHLGTYNCRVISGAEEGRWSEHATGNAIDIAGFVLRDGRQISILRDWDAGAATAGTDHGGRDDGRNDGRDGGSGGRIAAGEQAGPLPLVAAPAASARFLAGARDAACRHFGTVLSPDYNAAHRDHFHLDQGRSPASGVCR